ncbi:MAG: TPM domain-containing protein, partial [Luteolibacter sp.]
PTFGVVDESQFFSRNSGAFKRISDQLRKLEADHGHTIYLVVEPVLIGSTAAELAAELRRAWIPDGNGLVIVFEADSRRLGIGWDLTSRPDPPLGNSPQIPSHETSAMLTRARDAIGENLTSESYIETFISNLVGEHTRYFLRRAEPPPPGRSVKMGLLVVGTLSLLGLGGIAVGGLVRHSSITAARRFRFPVVDRPERLGAPCGGSVTTRSFATPRPR